MFLNYDWDQKFIEILNGANLDILVSMKNNFTFAFSEYVESWSTLVEGDEQAYRTHKLATKSIFQL